MFNLEYIDPDSIYSSSFNIKEKINQYKNLNRIILKEKKSDNNVRDSIVAFVVPRQCYPCKKIIQQYILKYYNLPIYFINDYKRSKCFILFPVLDEEGRLSYYKGTITKTNIDYIIRNKKELIFYSFLLPFAFSLDVLTSPIQLYLWVNFSDIYMSKLKGF